MPFPASFSLFSYFIQTVNTLFFQKSCRWLVSNPGTLVLEGTTLSTVPQKHCRVIIYEKVVFNRNGATYCYDWRTGEAWERPPRGGRRVPIRMIPARPENTEKKKRIKYFFKKWANPASFSFIFGLFKQTIHFLHQINVKKCPNVHGGWIRTHDLSNMSRHPYLLDQGFNP